MGNRHSYSLQGLPFSEDSLLAVDGLDIHDRAAFDSAGAHRAHRPFFRYCTSCVEEGPSAAGHDGGTDGGGGEVPPVPPVLRLDLVH